MSPMSLYDFEIILNFFTGKRRLKVVMGGVTIVTIKYIAIGALKQPFETIRTAGHEMSHDHDQSP